MDLRWEILVGYGPLFISGLWMTVQITLVAISVGLMLGVLFGLVSSSADAPPPTSAAARGLMKLARGITLAYVTFFSRHAAVRADSAGALCADAGAGAS